MSFIGPNVWSGSRLYSHRVLSSALAVSLLFISACSSSNQAEAPKVDVPLVSASPTVQDQSKEASVNVFYADSELIQLHRQSMKVNYRTTEEKIMQAFERLREKPAPPLISLFQSITFQSIQLKDGMLIIDLSIPAEGHYGASGEELTVRALIETAFQFDEVKSLDILLNGKKEETLMGHMELTHPIHK
jgi:spore germination protein GerM